MSWRQWLHQRLVSKTRTVTRSNCIARTDYPVGRILRDSRLYTVGAGTQEIRRMLIGREFNNELKGRS